MGSGAAGGAVGGRWRSRAPPRRPMTNDDVLYAYRLRVLASEREPGSVAAACRLQGIHRSTFYRWRS
jgi:transposase-like protein